VGRIAASDVLRRINRAINHLADPENEDCEECQQAIETLRILHRAVSRSVAQEEVESTGNARGTRKVRTRSW